jgi:hypothetical protein
MRFKQIIENSTTAGSVATVAQPMMTQTREDTNVKGLKPVKQLMKGKAAKKGPYANSITEGKVTEDDLAEQDLIVIPGQGRLRRTGFVKQDLDQGEHEGHTLKNSLHTIIRVATDLDKRLSVQSEFPEWVSEKIGATKSMMVTVMDYLISSQEMQHDRDDMNEGSQRIDSIVTDALRVMKGPEISDAVLALKRVLGDRAYNERRGFYSFYVDQIHRNWQLPMYGQQGVEEGMAEGQLNELDMWAPVTTFIKMTDGSYVQADWRRHQFKTGLDTAASFINFKPVNPTVVKQLGLDSHQRNKSVSGYRSGSIASGGDYQQSGPMSSRRYDVVDYNKPETMEELPDEIKPELIKWIQKQGVAEDEINTSRMNKQHQDFYNKNPNFKRDDREVKSVGGRLATKVNPANKPAQVAKKPMTPFEGKIDFAKNLQGKVDKHNKAVVKTKKAVGSRVADIGAGGKEHNEKTDAAWDAAKKKVSEGSAPKEKQKTPYRDINGPEYKAAADKQKEKMAKEPGEGKPKCLPQSKALSLGKKGRASAAARKRREDPNPDRSGKAINVNTKKTKGISNVSR